MNSTAEVIKANVKIPVLHIADATGRKIQERGVKTVALLGTAYTMRFSPSSFPGCLLPAPLYNEQ